MLRSEPNLTLSRPGGRTRTGDLSFTKYRQARG